MSGTKGRHGYVKSFGIGDRVEILRGRYRGHTGVITGLGTSPRRTKYGRYLRTAYVKLDDNIYTEQFGWGSLSLVKRRLPLVAKDHL